jgi:hypothetical protein
MPTFDDNAHKFFVDSPFWSAGISFSPNKAWMTLTDGVPVGLLESAAGIGSTFDSPLVPNVILFTAECVLLVPKSGSPTFSESDVRSKFDFGFVQGILERDIHVDFWGRQKNHGRMILHISMPNAFEVDTEETIKPFTRVRASRFSVTRINPFDSKFHRFKIISKFGDHPMLQVNHTVGNKGQANDQPPIKNFIRSVTSSRSFRTIFCFKDRSTNKFDSISSTEWSVVYNHTVSYLEKSDGSLERTVSGPNGKLGVPSGGNPSNVSRQDNDLLRMAEVGSPFESPSVLSSRLADASRRTITVESVNNDFDPSFFRSA